MFSPSPWRVCSLLLLLLIGCNSIAPPAGADQGSVVEHRQHQGSKRTLTVDASGPLLQGLAKVSESTSSGKDPEPWTIVWKDLALWVPDHKPFNACEISQFSLPVVIWVILGALMVNLLSDACAPKGSSEAILVMSIFAVFIENLLYSSVFVDSLDFASSVFGDQSASGTIIGIHKMGTGVGTLIVFLLFTWQPTMWKTHGYHVFIAAFAAQVLAALAFGVLSMLHVYTDIGGDTYFASIYLSRFAQGLAGGIQVACGLEQSAFLKTGLQRSIHNTRFYLGGCLGMGFGPLLSSMTTAVAHSVKCGEPPGYETTFAVCAAIPLVQLPVLRRLPKRMEAEGEDLFERQASEASGDGAQNRLVVVCACMFLQTLRSLSMASIEAALSELLYTEYHWNRRTTGIVTAALMFTMLPAQFVYEGLALRYSVNRAIRFLLVMALCGSAINFGNDAFSLLVSAVFVLPSLALSSGLIMGTMQIHCIQSSYIFDLTGCTLFSLLLSDFLGRGLGPQFARWAVARGGQRAFSEQQILISSMCVVVYELVHVCAIAKISPGGKKGPTEEEQESVRRVDSGTQCNGTPTRAEKAAKD